MFRVLFVSVAFPPKSDPESLQTAKYFHYLQKFPDMVFDVVTSAIPTLYMPHDQDLELYARGVQQLISIPLRENRYVNMATHRLGLSKYLYFPDVKQRFHKKSRTVLTELRQRPDIIYSRAEPKSSTILAFKLKNALNVPWVLHMSDPWADCPIDVKKGHAYDRHNRWERRCFEAANVIALTSMPTVEFYKEKYKDFSSKFRFYPNVFDDSVAQDGCVQTGTDKFRIVHTGGLSNTRSPEFLLKPLQIMFSRMPEIANQIEVIFAGAVDSANRGVFKKYNLPFVNWIGVVSYGEALRLQRSADYLVAIDSPITDPRLSMFFPSKLLDYMLARKRILVITTKGSASDEVMRDLNGDVCGHHESDKIVDAVSSAFRAYKEGNGEYMVAHNAPLKYSAAHNASRLHEEFQSLLKCSIG